MQQAALFSLLFFGTFTIYLSLGLYTIHRNPREELHRIFLGVCISLSFWSLGFAMANSAPTVEMCLAWRRISAVGWGTIYCLWLHYFTVLTGNKHLIAHTLARLALYTPAILSVYAFSISGKITGAQFNFIMTSHGWVNIPVSNGWTFFFNLYYISYMLGVMAMIWNWRNKTPKQSTKRQATILFIATVLAFLLGSVTDVVLSAVFKGPVPQMAPIFTLLPTTIIYLSMRHYQLMPDENDDVDSFSVASGNDSRLYYYLSFAFLAGGIVSALSHLLTHLLGHSGEAYCSLPASSAIFFLGLIILLLQLIKSEQLKNRLLLATTLLSVPVITLLFKDFAARTIWVFPMMLMTTSLIFDTQLPLTLFTLVSIATQILLKMYAPNETVPLNEFHYMARIGMFIVAFFVGSYVNRTYVTRLRENTYQVHFQKLVSEVSFDFVTINQHNAASKVSNMLHRIGAFFGADRVCYFRLSPDGGALRCVYEWCGHGISPIIDTDHEMRINEFPWWFEKIKQCEPFYLKSVDTLPDDASQERGYLKRRNIKSAVVIPINENSRIMGFLGMDLVTSDQVWSYKHITLLQTLANLLADGLTKVKAEEQIAYLAYYDPLTGLPNRTLFSDRLTQAINLAQRNEKLVAVFFLDLDHFKMVNDRLGHSGGDTVISEIGKQLAGRVRKTDTVARFGGDEFLVMANNLADIDGVIKVAEKLMAVFEKPFNVLSRQFYIKCSAGIAVYPFDGERTENLIKHADIAMYTAKSRGRNQYVVCTKEIRDDVQRNIRLSNSLYRVHERGELTVHYQPQINIASGQITGFEALARWRHPKLGMIPPAVFIPLAEANGTINSIGEWVLREAVQQAKIWQEKNLPHFRMGVNLSTLQLKNPQFVENVDKILKEIGLDPRSLELEITESIATREADYIVEVLNRLKRLGVSISIDDFGTEYSSLNRLKTLPIDRIKIDIQFIHGIEKSEKDQAITKVIINLAKSLGLMVIAEGVETAEQLEFLTQKMCDEVQGFYYYKPMPAEEIEQLLDSPSKPPAKHVSMNSVLPSM